MDTPNNADEGSGAYEGRAYATTGNSTVPVTFRSAPQLAPSTFERDRGAHGGRLSGRPSATPGCASRRSMDSRNCRSNNPTCAVNQSRFVATNTKMCE